MWLWLILGNDSFLTRNMTLPCQNHTHRHLGYETPYVRAANWSFPLYILAFRIAYLLQSPEIHNWFQFNCEAPLLPFMFISRIEARLRCHAFRFPRQPGRRRCEIKLDYICASREIMYLIWTFALWVFCMPIGTRLKQKSHAINRCHAREMDWCVAQWGFNLYKLGDRAKVLNNINAVWQNGNVHRGKLHPLRSFSGLSHHGRIDIELFD